MVFIHIPHPSHLHIDLRNQSCYLITDAMRAKGMPEGHYDLGGQDVIVKEAKHASSSGALVEYTQNERRT